MSGLINLEDSMMQTLSDTTEGEASGLETAVQDNLFALFRAMAGALPDSEIVETDKLSYHLAFPTNPMFKGVWQARLHEDEADEAIESTIAWFKARSAPFFFWWTEPGTAPGDLGQRLQAHGLLDMAEQSHDLAPGILSTERGAPCMVADLQHVNEAALAEVPTGFTITEVQNEVDLTGFKQVLIDGYEIPEMMADGWVQAALRIGFDHLPWKMYLGRLDGEPVATNMMLVGGGVAGIYGVATIPSARRRGIGGAISLFPLLQAREMGIRYAALFSTDMAIHAYERIGFRLTAGRINRYLWRNED
jgi:GNAT superfamily N-acetyltransferase